MIVLKLEKTIDGIKDTERKNMKELSILSKICIQNVSSVLVLCIVIVELNTEFCCMTERF